MRRKTKSAPLFPASVHSEFMNVTRQRYENMKHRLERKKLPPIPFTLDEFRKHYAKALSADGSVNLPADGGGCKCRYCGGWFGIAELAADHAIPLSRGGWIGLDNIEFCCARDNLRKGSLTPDEYLELLLFLENRIPLGRKDVLERLEKSVSVMAGQHANAGVIADLKQTGVWQAAQHARRSARKKV